MSRLGMLYALTEEEAEDLKKCPQQERYDYMLEDIEEILFGSPRSCELDKAWEGLQFCFGGGKWSEDNTVPLNIIFGGEFLVDTENEVITLKDPTAVKEIVAYLKKNDIQQIIKDNIYKIKKDEYSLPIDENSIDYLIGWSEDILSFYENAEKGNYYVIFSVDL